MFLFPILDEDVIFGDDVNSLSVIGTIHDHRARWNPFAEENEMSRSSESGQWLRWIHLSRKGGRHQDGVYNFRFVINHNPKKLLKLDSWDTRNSSEPDKCKLIASIKQTFLGKESRNFSVRVHHDCEVCLVVDLVQKTLTVLASEGASISAIDHVTSVQLNGFVWDSLDMFQKFDERIASKNFVQVSPSIWEKRVPLLSNGGLILGVMEFINYLFR